MLATNDGDIAFFICDFQKHLSDYPSVKLILANEEAIERKTRFVDEDLNRVFGRGGDNHERKLAPKVLAEASSAIYVLDIHTTTSEIKMTPIISMLNPQVSDALRSCPFPEIAYMQPPLADHALIGQVRAGISLEFNEEYAKTSEALDLVIKIIDDLQAQKISPPQKRKFYYINQTIPPDIKINKEHKNFSYITEHKIFPFLLGEKSYTTTQGFGASRMEDVLI